MITHKSNGPIVILGGTGYLGSTVAGHLAEAGAAVRVVGRNPKAVPPGVETVTADVRDRLQLLRAVAGASAVVHLVAEMDRTSSWRVSDTEQSYVTNVVPVIHLIEILELSAATPVVTTIGSATQVGCPPSARIDGSETDCPVTAYDRHKMEVEQRILEASGRGVIRGIPLRAPTIYGTTPATGPTGTGLVASLISRALADNPLTIWGNGDIQRDLLHVSDVADAIARAVFNGDVPTPLDGRTWLLGTGHGLSLREIFHAVSRAVAQQTHRTPVPIETAPPPRHAEPVDAQSYEIDASAYSLATGWRPHTTFANGLRDLVSRLIADNK